MLSIFFSNSSEGISKPEAKILASEVDLNAMIDLSDGIAGDLDHICRQSNVAAVIEPDLLPVSEAARQTSDPIAAALQDGEDFELLFCVSQADADRLIRSWPGLSDTRLTRIGEIIELNVKADWQHGRISLRQTDGTVEALKAGGWEHFRE